MYKSQYDRFKKLAKEAPKGYARDKAQATLEAFEKTNGLGKHAKKEKAA